MLRCPSSLILAAGCLALVAGTSRSADAQTSSPARPYVSGGVFGDSKWYSGDPTENVLDGHAVGGGLSLGAPMGGRWDLEIGVDIPRFSRTSRDRLVTYRKLPITLESVTENRAVTVTTLVRLRGARRGRVQLGYLAGLSVVRLQRRYLTDAPADTPAGLIPKPSGTVDYSAAPTLGVDAAFAIGGHLSIVPGVHVSVFRVPDLSGVLLRPRLGLRWAF